MYKKTNKSKTSLQFKLTLMFFFVMLVSASISVSVLVMVCSPVMKSNAEQQLVELSMAMDQLEEKGGFTVDEIVSIVNNSAYSLSVVDKNDSRVHDHFADIVHKGKALAVYPPASGEQPYNAGIHNLTTHKTYGILHYCKTR